MQNQEISTLAGMIFLAVTLVLSLGALAIWRLIMKEKLKEANEWADDFVRETLKRGRRRVLSDWTIVISNKMEIVASSGSERLLRALHDKIDRLNKQKSLHGIIEKRFYVNVDRYSVAPVGIGVTDDEDRNEFEVESYKQDGGKMVDIIAIELVIKVYFTRIRHD